MSQPYRHDADELLALRRLYPEYSDEELRVAQDNLVRYIEICRRILDRIRKDPEAYAKFRGMLEMKRSETNDGPEGIDRLA